MVKGLDVMQTIHGARRGGFCAGPAREVGGNPGVAEIELRRLYLTLAEVGKVGPQEHLPG